MHQVLRDDLGLGVVKAMGVRCGPAPSDLADELARVVDSFADGISDAMEARRKLSRELLRNGKYKPTGRSKPANEYLLRSATEGSFPRINGPVDANNLVSLKHMVPISLWDTDLAQSEEFTFRLGQPGESYVFNTGGQSIELLDLICGCRRAGEQWLPSVNPVKDSLATKTTEQSVNIAACVYFPLSSGGQEQLEQTTAELLKWVKLCGERVSGDYRVLLPGQQCEF